MLTVSMVIPLWVWHWLWAQPQLQLFIRSDFLISPFQSELCLIFDCIMSTLALFPHHPGAVQDVPRQRQPWRSGSFSFHHGLFQPHLHLLCAPHPVFHKGRALGLTLLTAVGIHVWTGRTVAGWECIYTGWFHPHVQTILDHFKAFSITIGINL